MPTKRTSDTHVLNTVTEVLTIFNRKQLDPEEAIAVLCASTAVALKMMQDAFPKTVSRQQQILDDITESIRLNLAQLQDQSTNTPEA